MPGVVFFVPLLKMRTKAEAPSQVKNAIRYATPGTAITPPTEERLH